LQNINELIFSKPNELRAHAELIRSFLSWPVITLLLGLTVICVFKGEVKVVLNHVGTVTVAGVTLTTQQQDLNEKVFSIQGSLAAQNVYAPIPGTPIAAGQEKARQRTAESLSKAANSIDPRQSLITVAKQLDNNVIEFLADSGSAAYIVPGDSEKNIKSLEERGYVPRDIADAGSLFFSLQKRLLDRKDATGLELSSLTQSGATILQALNSLPRGHKTVLQADVPIFGDAEAHQRLPGVGVLLEEVVTGDHPQTIRQLLPTTREGYYRPGMRVSWEWAFAPGWAQAWYRDPDSKKIVKAFDASANFVGRDLRELTK